MPIFLVSMRILTNSIIKKLRGLRGASELHRQSDRRRSAKLVPTLADRGVSRGQRNDPHGR